MNLSSFKKVWENIITIIKDVYNLPFKSLESVTLGSVTYTHQDYICLIKYTVKTVILLNISASLFCMRKDVIHFHMEHFYDDTEEGKSYRFGTTWGWANDDRFSSKLQTRWRDPLCVWADEQLYPTLSLWLRGDLGMSFHGSHEGHRDSERKRTLDFDTTPTYGT